MAMRDGKASARGATAAQLRDDIDSGATGDKSPGFDPAAAPLGTDEEAAGTPPSAAEVAAARAAERRPAADRRPNAANPQRAPDGAAGRARQTPPTATALLAGLALAVVLVLLWLLLA